jgi:tetratricopeptide (TPR) repeat protein
MAAARALLTPDVASSHPNLLWLLAEMELRDGHINEGTSLLEKMLSDDPSRRDALVILGCSVAEVNVEAGYQCIEVAAKAAIAADEWGSAAAALNEFVNRVPNHIPALMRLVEICVDGGLEATMHSAQGQLADAYLAAGAGAEARVIAEDLVAREPWDRSNIERFRRALTLLGEQDVDGIIADRLSGQTPFTSKDFVWPSDPGGSEMAPMPVEPQTTAGTEEVTGSTQKESATLETNRDDVVVAGKAESHEVDLAGVLQELREEQAESDSGVQAAPPIEQVLEQLREDAAQDMSPETAERHFELAATYVKMGMQNEAMKALELAARSPQHRFRAGAMLAKAYLGSGDPRGAIEWYERAVEAPAPAPMARSAVLYELASVLETQGESARALAVLLELQAHAGEYRDVSKRLEQLKVQMGS